MAKLGNGKNKTRFSREEQRYYVIRAYILRDTTVEAEMVQIAKDRGLPLVGSYKQCISTALDEYNKSVERNAAGVIDFYTNLGADPRLNTSQFDLAKVASQNVRPTTLP